MTEEKQQIETPLENAQFDTDAEEAQTDGGAEEARIEADIEEGQTDTDGGNDQAKADFDDAQAEADGEDVQIKADTADAQIQADPEDEPGEADFDDAQAEADAEDGRIEADIEPDEDVDFETTVESVIEAVLFASDEPLTPARLANIVETGIKQIREHIGNLNAKYRTSKNAFRIEQIAGGYQMLTLSPFNYWLKKLLRARSESKLSPAALETLAIVAYKQPVIRADIEVIRGVAVGEVIRGLMYKGLVKIVGRAEVLGRPMLYGTTKKFLEVFGLNSLKDLPKVEELKRPPS